MSLLSLLISLLLLEKLIIMVKFIHLYVTKHGQLVRWFEEFCFDFNVTFFQKRLSNYLNLIACLAWT
jgi:hypothetical protein